VRPACAPPRVGAARPRARPRGAVRRVAASCAVWPPPVGRRAATARGEKGAATGSGAVDGGCAVPLCRAARPRRRRGAPRRAGRVGGGASTTARVGTGDGRLDCGGARDGVSQTGGWECDGYASRKDRLVFLGSCPPAGSAAPLTRAPVGGGTTATATATAPLLGPPLPTPRRPSLPASRAKRNAGNAPPAAAALPAAAAAAATAGPTKADTPARTRSGPTATGIGANAGAGEAAKASKDAGAAAATTIALPTPAAAAAAGAAATAEARARPKALAAADTKGIELARLRRQIWGDTVGHGQRGRPRVGVGAGDGGGGQRDGRDAGGGRRERKGGGKHRRHRHRDLRHGRTCGRRARGR